MPDALGSPSDTLDLERLVPSLVGICDVAPWKERVAAVDRDARCCSPTYCACFALHPVTRHPSIGLGAVAPWAG